MSETQRINWNSDESVEGPSVQGEPIWVGSPEWIHHESMKEATRMVEYLRSLRPTPIPAPREEEGAGEVALEITEADKELGRQTAMHTKYFYSKVESLAAENSALKRALSAAPVVEEAPERKVTWVSVKDSLPEYGVQVLARKAPQPRWGHKENFLVTSVVKYDGKREFTWFGADINKWITHWMPLPQPPEVIDVRTKESADGK